MEKTTRIVAQIWDDAGHEEEKPSGKHSCKDGQRGWGWMEGEMTANATVVYFFTHCGVKLVAKWNMP